MPNKHKKSKEFKPKPKREEKSNKPMGRRSSSSRNLPFKSLFKPRNPKPFSSNSFPSPSPSAWRPCKQPKTLSFRLITEEVHDDNGNHLAYLDSTTDTCFTTSSASFEYSEIFSTSDCSVKAAMQAMSSNRLLLDGRSARSFSKKEVGVPFEGSVAVEVESEDLYRDFLISMKEIVEASREVKKDFVWFEEMLEWYLRMNKKWTHEFIVGAYWDLLSQMMGSSSSCSSATSGLLPSCCSSSSSSSSYVSCLSEINEEAEEEGNS